MIIFKVIELKLYLSYIQFHHIQTPRLLDVDAIYAIEGIDDGLSAIGDDRVAHALRDNLDAHSRFDTNTVDLLAVLRGDLKYCHNAKGFIFLVSVDLLSMLCHDKFVVKKKKCFIIFWLQIYKYSPTKLVRDLKISLFPLKNSLSVVFL